MKTLKFLLAVLLLMCGAIAHAQSVVVYKKDGTKVKYAASEVKNVKYKKGETVYYWYAGWTVPSADNISTIINETAPVSSTDPTTNKLGGTTKQTTFTKDNPLAKLDVNRYNPNEKATYYVVIPNGTDVYANALDVSITSSTLKITDISIPNHKVYKSSNTSRNINAFAIY